MFKKLLSVSMAAIISLSALTACGNQKEEKKEESTTSKDGKEITLMIPDWGVPTKEMLDEFKKESGITVKVLPTSWDDIKNKVSIAAAGKKAAADVYEVDWSWVGEFKSAGWLEKLDVDSETQKDIASISSFKFGDDVYAIPYSNDLRVSYENKDMLEKAGITGDLKTWDQVTQAFDKMKEKKVIEYPFLFPLYAEEKCTTSFITLAYTRNGKLFNEDGTLNRESVLDTLTFLKECLDKGYIDPASVSTPGMDTFKAINQAKGAMLIGPTSYISSSNDPKESKVVGQLKAELIPGMKDYSDSTIAFTEAVGVSAYSENKDAAKKFVEWFSKPETQLELNKAINNIPTRTSVIKKMVDEKILKDPGKFVELSQMIKNPFPNGVPSYYTKMSTEIFNTVNQLGQGKLSPAEATDQMIKNVNKIIDENK